MLKKILLANFLIELVGAIFLLLKPTILIDTAELTQFTGGVIRMYAISAIILGAISLQCYKFFKHSPMIRIITISFVAFHLMLGMQLHTMYRAEVISMPAPAYFHLAVGFIIAIFYYQEKELFIEQSANK